MVSAVWKEHEQGRRNDSASINVSNADSRALATVTVQTENVNIVIRSLQPKMLFVLVGGVPPGTRQPFKEVAEFTGDPRFPSEEAGSDAMNEPSANGPQPSSQISPTPQDEHVPSQEDMRLGALHLQRKKADSMAETIIEHFGLRDFEMPDDSIFS